MTEPTNSAEIKKSDLPTLQPLTFKWTIYFETQTPPGVATQPSADQISGYLTSGVANDPNAPGVTVTDVEVFQLQGAN